MYVYPMVAAFCTVAGRHYYRCDRCTAIKSLPPFLLPWSYELNSVGLGVDWRMKFREDN